MVRTTVLLSCLTLGLGVAALAGTIEGKTSPGGSVVFVAAIPGKTFPAPTQEPVLSQKGLAFDPHVLVAQEGTTVQFENDDSVQHNVFWPSVGGNRKLAHNMGTWPKGEKRPFKFTQPGVVPLLCNVHPEMSGYIVVSPTPYFAQTDAAGNYKIDNVPDGKYTVTAWHEGSKPQSKPVNVSGAGKADFMLSQ
jgi:plastocyanin